MHGPNLNEHMTKFKSHIKRTLHCCVRNALYCVSFALCYISWRRFLGERRN